MSQNHKPNHEESVLYDFTMSRHQQSQLDEPSMVFLERHKIEQMKAMIRDLEMENLVLKGYARYGINPREILNSQDEDEKESKSQNVPTNTHSIVDGGSEYANLRRSYDDRGPKHDILMNPE